MSYLRNVLNVILKINAESKYNNFVQKGNGT